MKRIFASVLMLALTIGVANAQKTKQDKKEGAQKEHRNHHQGLNLSEDQKAKMASLREKHKAGREIVKGERKEMMQRHRAEMEAILTPAQKAEMQKKRAEKSTAYKAGRKGVNKEGKMGRKGAQGRGAEVSKQLNLTSNQQAKMKAAQTDFRTKMQSLRTDNNLSAEQKAAKRKELAQQHQAQVKNILTKEQQEKMQQMRKERSGRNAK